MGSRRLRRSGPVKKPLDSGDACERKERRQNAGKHHLTPIEQNEKKRPEKKYETDAGFEDAEGPILNTSMRQHTEGKEGTKSNANRLHRGSRSAATGTRATSSIQPNPPIPPSGIPVE